MDENSFKASFAYFENRSCMYYPCHNSEHINCLFCYCPLYRLSDCPGEYEIIEAPGGKIKTCVNCTFPHDKANYGRIITLLKENKYFP